MTTREEAVHTIWEGDKFIGIIYKPDGRNSTLYKVDQMNNRDIAALLTEETKPNF